MLYDFLIFAIVVVSAGAGWHIGIINSWRSPFAMVAATFGTQKLYIDAATHLVGHLKIQPAQGVTVVYLVMWPLFYVIAETILRVVLPFNSKERPLLFGRIFGACWGLVVGLMIVILPGFASDAPIAIPIPAADTAHLEQPIDNGISASSLVPAIKRLSQGLYGDIGKYAVSTSGPSFKPDYKVEDDQERQDK
jgi:hypothetical protein